MSALPTKAGFIGISTNANSGILTVDNRALPTP